MSKHNVEPGDEYSSTSIIVPDQYGKSELKKQKSLGEYELTPNQILINSQVKMTVEEYDDFVEQKEKTECSSLCNSEAQKDQDYDVNFYFQEKEPKIDFKDNYKRNRKLQKRQANILKFQEKNALMSYTSFNKRKFYLQANPYYNQTQNILEKQLRLNPPTIQARYQFQNWINYQNLDYLRSYYWYLMGIRLSIYRNVYDSQQDREYWMNELSRQYPKWQVLYISWITQYRKLDQAFNYHPCELDTHNFRIKEQKNMIQQMVWNIKNHYKDRNRKQLYYWQNDNEKVTALLTIMTGWGKHSLDDCDSKNQTIKWCNIHKYKYHVLKDQVDIQIPLQG